MNWPVLHLEMLFVFFYLEKYDFWLVHKSIRVFLWFEDDQWIDLKKALWPCFTGGYFFRRELIEFRSNFNWNHIYYIRGALSIYMPKTHNKLYLGGGVCLQHEKNNLSFAQIQHSGNPFSGQVMANAWNWKTLEKNKSKKRMTKNWEK